ncbi:uncharacterized membrane protein YgdD (TMEM256/DUF423 family) [Dokdonia sp. Hel_I_63]|uniref:DUF423 domain-containing protein n=1 Tax=Dokdonia sp. Hel_I_63 TaxID=1249996 RepID=UPI00119BB763|nr:DUF423 domain-containing protein [Dokdonia sp. Hel_I_63]TVZ21406.1 uncharacterized membrane protein YgdD (TMEM256/DUF423 family) [Dokdonia sp. Hel_I_63]
MDKKLRVTGGIFGLTAVIIGAFGAHGLEKVLDASAIATFETGVKYQMYHALLLLLIPVFALSEKTKKIVWVLLLLGILFFSGSIYGLATNELTSFDFTKIALITPIGGTLLIVSWLLIVIHFIKSK